MTAVEELVECVRADGDVTAINDRHRRGVEAFLQAYAYVENGNPGQTPAQLCELAESYLIITASPGLTEMEWRAVEVTKEVLVRLAG